MQAYKHTAGYNLLYISACLIANACSRDIITYVKQQLKLGSKIYMPNFREKFKVPQRPVDYEQLVQQPIRPFEVFTYLLTSRNQLNGALFRLTEVLLTVKMREAK